MTIDRDAPAPLDDEVVGWDVVDRLLQDLALVAEMLEVQVKAGAARCAQSGPLDLPAARRALGDGAAVQLRYRHAGVAWCDTLLPRPEGVRIVRARMG